MFDHVTIRVSDRAAAERFYDAVLAPLDVGEGYSDADFAEWGDFSLSTATEKRPVTRGLHVAFAAASRERVDAFWHAGTAAGYRDDGAPGLRPQYRDDYYGAFLLDPDGNSVEAVHHGGTGSGIQHVWLRVADVEAAKRFYETVGAYAGFSFNDYQGDRNRAQFVGDGGSFSVVGGTPTEHVHFAFPVDDNAAVDAFHRAATEAGYRDNGPPGERPMYHAGYYGAFVLDPDGNNVELVNHNR